MRKFLLAIGLIFVLAGCAAEESKPKETAKLVAAKKEEPTQEQLNETLKREAMKADFVELNVDEPPIGKKVFAEGKVDVLTVDNVMDEFFLTTREGDGYGMYKINLLKTTGFNFEYSEGDQVRIYGGVTKKEEDGTPQIIATIIEKVE